MLYKSRKNQVVVVKEPIMLCGLCESQPYYNGVKCINYDCRSVSKFNYEGFDNKVYCKTHSTLEMVNYFTNRICKTSGCDKRSIYNVRGLKNGLFCLNHKIDEMINVMNKRCISDGCDTQVKKNKYRGYCIRCFIYTFPSETVSRNYKTKERNVVDCIKTMFPDLDWKEDKIISCGCSKRRPDMLLDIVYCVIVIEIDENQHTDYDSNCETKRMMEISQDVGHRPVVFIRFNPDKYTNDSVKITSCWGVDGNGLFVVKKCKINEWKERTDTLNKLIQYCIDNPSDKMIDVIHLFYDLP